jgi:hypothetical protein
VSAADSEAAVNRLAGKRKELGEGDFSAYAFLALGMLGHSTPNVLNFLLDQVDATLDGRE